MIILAELCRLRLCCFCCLRVALALWIGSQNYNDIAVEDYETMVINHQKDTCFIPWNIMFLILGSLHCRIPIQSKWTASTLDTHWYIIDFVFHLYHIWYCCYPTACEIRKILFVFSISNALLVFMNIVAVFLKQTLFLTCRAPVYTFFPNSARNFD